MIIGYRLFKKTLTFNKKFGFKAFRPTTYLFFVPKQLSIL